MADPFDVGDISDISSDEDLAIYADSVMQSVEDDLGDTLQDIDEAVEEIAEIKAQQQTPQAAPYTFDISSPEELLDFAVQADPTLIQEQVPDETDTGSPFFQKIKRLAGIAAQEAERSIVGAASLSMSEGVGITGAGTDEELQPVSFVEEVTGVIGQVAGQAAVIKASTATGARVGAFAGPKGAAVGAGVGLVSGIGATLWHAVRMESEGVRDAALMRGASPEAADAAAKASALNIAVTEGLSLIPITAFAGRAGKIFKASDVLPEEVVTKMQGKVFDRTVANGLSKLGIRSKRIREAVTAGGVGFVAEGTTESIQGGLNDAFIALAAGETTEQAFLEALDPGRRFHEFMVAGTGAGIVTGALAGASSRETKPPVLALPAPPEDVAPIKGTMPTPPEGIDPADIEDYMRRAGGIISTEMTADSVVLNSEALLNIAKESPATTAQEGLVADEQTLKDNAAQEAVRSLVLDPQLANEEYLRFEVKDLSSAEDLMYAINTKYETVTARMVPKSGQQVAPDSAAEPAFLEIRKSPVAPAEKVASDRRVAMREVQAVLSGVEPAADVSPYQEKTISIQRDLLQLEETGEGGDRISIPLKANPFLGDPGVQNQAGLIAAIEQLYGNTLKVAGYDPIRGIVTVEKRTEEDLVAEAEEHAQDEVLKSVKQQETTLTQMRPKIEEIMGMTKDASLVMDADSAVELEAIEQYANEQGLYTSYFDNGKTFVITNFPSDATSPMRDRLRARQRAEVEKRQAHIQARADSVDIQYPGDPDQAATIVPRDYPESAKFYESVPVDTLQQIERQQEINKQSNSRLGLYGPQEIPGADNPIGFSETGTVYHDEGSMVNDPLLGGPDLVWTPELLDKMEQLSLEKSEGGEGFMGGLAQNLDPTTVSPMVTNKGEIIQEMAKLTKMMGGVLRPATLGTAQGRLKNVAGTFDPKTIILRTEDAGDIVSAAHEIGHLVKHVLITDGALLDAYNNPVVTKELNELGMDKYGDHRPVNGYASEGFAELTRLYLTRDRSILQKKAPNALAMMEQVMQKNPKVKTQADTVHKFVQAYSNMSPIEQMNNDREHGEADEIKKRNRARKYRPYFQISKENPMWRIFLTRMVDEGDAIHRLETELDEWHKKKYGEPLAHNLRPYTIFDANRGTAGERVGHMVLYGMMDANLNPVSVGGRVGSLKDAIAPVRHDMGGLKTYLWAKRAVTVYNANSAIPGFVFKNPGVSREVAEAVVQHVESMPDGHKYIEAADRITAYIDGILNYTAQMSPRVMGPVLDRIKKNDPGYYIPLQRMFTEMEGTYSDLQQIEKTLMGDGASIFSKMRAKGSGRGIKDPLHNIITYTQNMVTAAHNFAVMETMYAVKDLPGMSKYITEINPEKEFGVSVSATQAMQKLLAAKGVDAQGNVQEFSPETKAEVRKILRGDGADLADMYAELFITETRDPKGEWTILPVRIDGEMKWLEIDGGIYDGLMSSKDLFAISTFSKLALHIPNRLFRAGTTTANIAFSLGTNVARDLRSFMVQSQDSAKAPLQLYTWFPMVWRSFMYAMSRGKRTGIFTKDIDKELFDFASRSGLFKSNRLEQDVSAMRRVERRMKEKHGFSAVRLVDSVASAFEFYTDLLSSTETATRVAEMKLKAKDLGILDAIESGGAIKLNQEQSMELLRAGKRVTTDFAAAGTYSRRWNRMIPFLNAAIQGPRALVRAIDKDPGAAIWRMFGHGALVSLSLWYWNKDEDWWKDLTSTERYLYTWIPFEFDGRKELVRIPRAFEIDGFSMAIMEAMADAAYNKDPKAVKEWIGSAWRSVMPGSSFEELGIPHVPLPMPVVISEMHDQIANYDHFFGRPLVPRGMSEHEKPENQYYEHSSNTAKFLGKLFSWSPIRIDHAIRGMTGAFGIDTLKNVEEAYEFLESVAVEGKAPAEVLKDKELKDKIPIFGVFINRTGQVSRAPRVIDELYETADIMHRNRREETPLEKRQRLMLADGLQAISAMNKIANMTDDVDKRRKIFKRRRDLAVQLQETLDKNMATRERYKAIKKQAQQQADLLALKDK